MMSVNSELFVIMGTLWLMAASAFCGYKLYKLYCEHVDRAPALPTTHLDQTDSARDRTSARVTPIFKSLLPDICRAGETMSLQITFPKILRSGILDPQLQNQLTSLLSIKIYQQRSSSPTAAADLGEILPIIFQYQPVREGDKDIVLIVKFTVKQAGMYQCDVRYRNSNILGTPIFKHFHAGHLDPECTAFQRKSPAILCVTEVPFYGIIEPKDRHGNLCQIQDVDMNMFKVEITEVQKSKKGMLVEPVTYSFSQEFNDWGIAQPSVRLQLEIFLPGTFSGTIFYNGTVIRNGNFDITCLTTQENDKLKAILSDNPGAMYHEANLLYVGLETENIPLKSTKTRKVYVYVGPQVLSVKEYYFGIIPTQLASYRVLPATRINLVTLKGKNDSIGVISFSDRSQPKILLQMDIGLGRIVIALFQYFLQQRLGGSESFENKQRFFHQELRKVVSEKYRPSATVLNIKRNDLIDSTLKETKIFGSKDWCRKFKIKFVGEEGSDEGNSRLVLPNSDRDTIFTLKHYELAGHVVAKCMFETAVGGHFKQMVNARFGRSFLAQIIGFPPHYKYFEQDDPELYDAKVKYILDSSQVDDMDLTFSEEVYAEGKLVSVIDLIPNGAQIKVTNQNKSEYLQALAHQRLCSQVRKEIESFVKGLNDIIPYGLLTNFDENELEILMCGLSTIHVEDLKNFHVVTPSSETHCTKIVSWFWIAVENMTESERARLLQFTTGSSLLPHGGFHSLEPKFRITVYGTTGKLPIAHTCFNEICLSNHHLFEDFEKSLKTAVTEGNEGFSFN
ncbi:unnamed protein product [Allacma fusca]|uniref:HECT domain-containing protein n=1 Tax=Allacma fusca TaxID=39272 RepID=A0A8J2JUU1_9HEXA|nr:unnamed protein product [Allacma fusca]